MGEILDHGSLLFASVAALVAAMAAHSAVAVRLPVSFYTPFLILAAVYVPGLLLLASMVGGAGGAGMVFRRDYSPLLTCVAMGFAAACLPLVLAGWTAPLQV